MGDYGLSTSWGSPRVGREAAGLALWGDALTLAEKQKANGEISEYTVQLFGLTGGALPSGIFTIWGTQEQVLAAQIDEERTTIVQRVGLCNENVVETFSIRGEAVMEGVGRYTELINSL